MKMLVGAALVLFVALFCAIPATAATVPLPNCMNYPAVYTPCQGVIFADPVTGNPLALSGGALPTTDPNNGSYSHFSESSSAASYTFASANVAKERGWYANCPANTTETVTLTDATGSTKQITLYDGPYGPAPDVIASYSGNTAGCGIGLEY